MISRVFSDKLKEYNPANDVEQEHVLAELMQMLTLSMLAKTDFFIQAAFHGGTFLRLFHNLDRFSEDLDFVLKRRNPGFAWAPYLEQIKKGCEAEGVHFEVVDKSHADNAVKKAFLKSDSVGKVLLMELPFDRFSKRKIKIKFEIDTHPPVGSKFETNYLSFPMPSPVTTQTLGSSFAGKLHALLCRPYLKGRDWYDFIWYVSKKTALDAVLLENALKQTGPWAESPPTVTPAWTIGALRDRIKAIDWVATREDVRPFVPLKNQEQLALWGDAFFLKQADYLSAAWGV